ncbi:unnamed protein product, partial [Rotaria magnacalcarata]
FPNNTAINDNTNPLFRLAQHALEREKHEQQQQGQSSQDISNKLKAAWSYFHTSKSNLSSTHGDGVEHIITTTTTTPSYEVGLLYYK